MVSYIRHARYGGKDSEYLIINDKSVLIHPAVLKRYSLTGVWSLLTEVLVDCFQKYSGDHEVLRLNRGSLHVKHKPSLLSSLRLEQMANLKLSLDIH